MPRNGAGVYERVTNWVEDKDNDVRIVAVRHDEQDDDIATALTQSLSRDGQSPPTANLPMGGFKFTNVAKATANGEVLVIAGGITNGDAGKVPVVQADSSLLVGFPSPPITRVDYAAQNLLNNTWVTMGLNTSVTPFDDADWWVSSAPTRVTMNADGRVNVSGEISFSATAAGVYGVRVKKNGSVQKAFLCGLASAVGGYQSVGLPALTISVANTDYLEMDAIQITGAGVDTLIGSWFEVRRTR